MSRRAKCVLRERDAVAHLFSLFPFTFCLRSVAQRRDSYATGSRIVNVEPVPSTLSTRMAPPWASTMARAM
jgi:hypothetical protein